MLSLSHNTSVANAIKIFESGFVYTELDAIMKKVNLGEGLTSAREQSKMKVDDLLEDLNMSQYPGVYMSLITKRLVGEKYRKGVNLIFCMSLLYRKDWHFNKMDSEGHFNEGNTAMSFTQLGDLLENLKKDENISDNEIIFHHSVPVNFISKINFSNFLLAQEFYHKCSEKLKKIVAPLIQVVETIPDERYLCPGEIKAMTPNFCFVFDDSFHWHATKDEPRGYHRHMEYYRWMAMQCGLSREQVNAVKTPQELNKMLRPLVQKRFRLVAEGKW
jgi:hypothetical protein